MTLLFGKYGITSAGFAMTTQAQLFADYKDAIQQAVPSIDLRDGSVFNLFLNANSNILFSVLQQMENIWYAKDPTTAIGMQQDALYALNDLTRLTPAPSVVKVVCKGDNGSTIPVNTQISSTNGDIFINKTVGGITMSSCVKAIIQINNVSDNTPYNIDIDGYYVGITSGSGQSKAELLTLLSNAILSETLIDCAVNIDGDNLEISTSNPVQPVSIAVSSNFTVGKISSIVTFYSLNDGEVLVNANTINVINTITSGLDEVNNPVAGELGREVETDQEFRARQQRIGIYNRSSATYNAILSAFNDTNQITGVSYVNLNINDELTENAEGLPAKSIELVIQGGNDNDIANLLWNTKAGGIATYGNTSIDVIDGAGNTRVVKFSRPVKKYVWFRAVITSSGDLHSNYVEQVKEYIMQYTQKLGVGSNVMLKVAGGFVLSNLSGISNVVISAFTTDAVTGTGTYTENDIAISSNEVAMFDKNRIEVL